MLVAERGITMFRTKQEKWDKYIKIRIQNIIQQHKMIIGSVYIDQRRLTCMQ